MTKTCQEKTVLVTGGSGSFGKVFIQSVMREFQPRKLIVFSRDELKQHQMHLGSFGHPTIHFVLGDVRDRISLQRALDGVDVVVHTAAMKHVPACEQNPIEAIATNITGSQNVVDTAIDAGVGKVIMLSTDKAVEPSCLYGATKMCAERLFMFGNSILGTTKISCVRLGNLAGSRGSVVPLFYKQRESGTVTVTDERMTRFWLTVKSAVEFVLHCLDIMNGGEVFVPKIPSVKIMDLVEAIAPRCKIKYTGIRPGEKLHETIMADNEASRAFNLGEMYIIPNNPDFHRNSPKLPDGFRYTSDTNSQWLSVENLKEQLYGEMEM